MTFLFAGARFCEAYGVTAEGNFEGLNILNLIDAPTPDDMAGRAAAEEALANIRRHAHAGSVWIGLGIEDGRLVLTVEDDGVGFDPIGVRSAAAKGAQFRPGSPVGNS